MPEIKGMSIDQAEWERAVIRVNELVRLSKERNVTNEQFNMLKEHVVEMIERLKKGRQRLDQDEVIMKNNPSAVNKERIHRLESLYRFLVELVGLYDDFFKMKLSREDYEKVLSYFLQKWGME